MNRAQLLAYRVRAQQLDRDTGGTVANTAVLDLGVQQTGPDGADRWALAVRGLTRPRDSLAGAWTLRGAPHTYRQADLSEVATATAPWSEADAASRVFDAARPLKAAGIGVVDALDHLADEMADLVDTRMVKGELSGALGERLPAPYLRHCRPCDAVHTYEQTFRLAALRAGLTLRAGTSPPVLETGGPHLRGVPTRVHARFDIVRAYLRLFGPATPQQVAAYVDSTVAEVKRHWPVEAEPVDVDREPRSWLPAESSGGVATELPDRVHTVRLLMPFDPYLQMRDRELLVPDEEQRNDLWRILGRPGAVLVDGEIAGTWRPRSAGRKLTITLDPWQPLSPAERSAVDAQAEQLATAQGRTLAAVVDTA